MISASPLSLCLAIAGIIIGIASVDALAPSFVGHPIAKHQQLGFRQRNSSPSSLGSSVIEEIDSFYQTFPYASAFITCGIKASAADIVAQKNEVIPEDRYDYGNEDSFMPTMPSNAEGDILSIDARRNFSFIMYGGLYQGIAQFIIFNQIFPLIFGDGTDITTVISKVLFDNMFVSPLLCLPVAYLVKSVVYQFTLEEAKSRYIQDVKDGLIFKYWCFWMPAQSLTFSVVPEHLRILFIAAVSFFWLVVFSSISSNASADGEKS